MKKSLVFFLLVISSVYPAFSQVSSSSADLKKVEKPSAMNEMEALHSKDPVKEYGAGANAKEAIKISEVLESPDKFLDKEITVAGLIVDVCPKRGCWMMFASDKKFQTLRIKVNDGEMVFPLSARGHDGTARGKLVGNKLSQEQTIKHFQHLAEEKGEKFDPASVTGPTTVYMLKASGAVVK